MSSVVFTLERPDGKLLLEQRRADDPIYAGAWVFPGGRMHRNEPPFSAMLRECGEELGVRPATAYLVPNDRCLYHVPEDNTGCYETSEPLARLEPYRVHPYLITEWSGEVPAAILDTGNPLEWFTAGEAFGFHPLDRSIVEAIERFRLCRAGYLSGPVPKRRPCWDKEHGVALFEIK